MTKRHIYWLISVVTFSHICTTEHFWRGKTTSDLPRRGSWSTIYQQPGTASAQFQRDGWHLRHQAYHSMSRWRKSIRLEQAPTNLSSFQLNEHDRRNAKSNMPLNLTNRENNESSLAQVSDVISRIILRRLGPVATCCGRCRSCVCCHKSTKNARLQGVLMQYFLLSFSLLNENTGSQNCTTATTRSRCAANTSM